MEKKSDSSLELEQLAKRLVDQAITNSSTPPMLKHLSLSSIPTVTRPQTAHPNLPRKMTSSQSSSALPTSKPVITAITDAKKLVVIGRAQEGIAFK